MLQKVIIKNVATFDNNEHIMDNFNKLNFIFGANGSGKTTISRILANPEKYPECQVQWDKNQKIFCRVYNSDFVNQNFSTDIKVPGIFTLGQDENETKEKIQELNKIIHDTNIKLERSLVNLNGDKQIKGKTKELQEVTEYYSNQFWKQKKKYDTTSIKEGMSGVLGSKEKFFQKVLQQYRQHKKQEHIDFIELNEKAKTVFNRNISEVPSIPNIDFRKIERLGQADILAKKIIGKKDIDISALIESLENSDWIKAGIKYLDKSDKICPFCQQPLKEDFRAKIEEYFDESYLADLQELEQTTNEYKEEYTQIISVLKEVYETCSALNLLDNEDLQQCIIELEAVLRNNNEKIAFKKENASIPVILESSDKIFEKITKLLNMMNAKIKQHNELVENINEAKLKLKKQIWNFIVQELHDEIIEYNDKSKEIEKQIEALKRQIQIYQNEVESKREKVEKLQAQLTSVVPTKDSINNYLQQFGFTGFRLNITDDEKSYVIVRNNGDTATTTLSEGERNFITFLYFYLSLRGTLNKGEDVIHQTVIIDDPVSSMDNEILFIVSSLIRSLYNEIMDTNGNIKQVLVLTHNLYFYKEVSFTMGLPKGASKCIAYWVVKKVYGKSQIKSYDKNPIQSTYGVLWTEIREAAKNSSDKCDVSLQNSMRRILEHYYKYYGGINLNKIPEKIDKNEKIIARSLISWINDGSHSCFDDFFYCPASEYTVEQYLRVFKHIFERMGHIAHYNMMMQIEEESENG